MPRPKNATPRFTLHMLPSSIYEIRWTEGGNTRAKSTGKRDKTEATAFLNRFVVEWGTPKAPVDPLIRDLIAGYLPVHLPKAASPDTMQVPRATSASSWGTIARWN